MNKRIISPILIAVIATVTALPVLTFPSAHAQGSGAVYVTDYQSSTGGSNLQNNFAGNPGDTFSIAVWISNVDNLVGYDLTLQYNNNALMVTSVDFDQNTVFCLDGQGVAHTPCRTSSTFSRINDASTGTIRSAMALQASSMNVDGSTGDLPAIIINLQVLARVPSPLHLLTDEGCACQSLAAQMLDGSIGAVDHSTADGGFFPEPNIMLVAAYKNFTTFAVAVPQVSHLRLGQTSVTLEATVTLGSTETLAGFTFVVFDVIDPHGNDIPVQSDSIVLLPGDMKQVTAPFSFSSSCAASCGSYLILVTLWRGSVDFAMAPFQQATGFHFRVNR